MATASDRKTANQRSSSRGRDRTQSAARKSSARSSSRSAQSKSSARRSSQRKSSNGTQRKRGNGTQRKSANAARAQANGAQSQVNDRSQDHIGREAITAVIGATVGVAGGVLLGRTALARERKVLGIPLPKKIDLAGVGQQLGEAGRQFGKLAGEVRDVREKAEQIGRVLT